MGLGDWAARSQSRHIMIRVLSFTTDNTKMKDAKYPIVFSDMLRCEV